MDGENTNDAGQICLSCSSRFCPKLYIFPLRALQTLLRREEADDADDEACPKALGWARGRQLPISNSEKVVHRLFGSE